MAKERIKKKKKPKAADTAAQAAPQEETALSSEAPAEPAKPSKVRKAVKKARKAASKISEKPMVAEVIAAALVATAAAIKDPAKARRLAGAAGEELQDASKKASRKSDLFWNLALDIARRTLEGVDRGGEQSDASQGSESKRSKPKA